MKIITAANALTVLGPDHRFTTKVVSLGRGRVAIVGGGDATLSARAVRRLANRTVAAVKADPSLQNPPGTRPSHTARAHAPSAASRSRTPPSIGARW